MTRIATLLFTAVALAGAANAQQPAPPDRFVDVPQDHWAYQAVENLRVKGIVVGYPDGQLRGKRTITRYEAATGLNRSVAAVERAIQQKRSTAAPSTRGPQGPKGERGPQGTAGPPGDRPHDLDLFPALNAQLRAEVAELWKQLEAAEKKIGETEQKVKK